MSNPNLHENDKQNQRKHRKMFRRLKKGAIEKQESVEQRIEQNADALKAESGKYPWDSICPFSAGFDDE